MVALRESPARVDFRPLAPLGQVLGDPRFRWLPHPEAWLYRLEVTDAWGRTVARGWSGVHECPLAWLRDMRGAEARLSVGERYRWQVFAYKDGPDAPPHAEAPEGEFLFLGP